MRADRTVILASAGSGKTYRLSAAYLRLISAGVDPRSVLATTFTRKAAGEIARRALRRAHQAATDSAHAERLTQETKPHGRSPDWASVALRLARHVDQIRVQTLDSFFVSIAQGGSYELGLTPGWSIAHPVEDESMRNDAIASAVDEADQSALIELLRMLAAGDHNWSVLGTLRSVLDDASEAYFAADGDLAPWNAVSVPAGELSGDELRAALADLEQMPLPQTKKTKKPNAVWAKARSKVLETASRQDWIGLLKGGLIQAVTEEVPKFSGIELDREHIQALTPIEQHASAMIVAELKRRTLATYALVRTAVESLLEQRSSAGRYTFSDIPRALARIPERERELIYEGLDLKLEHLLLDEFQDTSSEQYRLFSPIIDEIVMDAERSRAFVCVGDLKQALYLWREAAPEILGGLRSRYEGELDAEHLALSYRTSKPVLDTVNEVFSSVGSSSACAGPGRAGAQRFEDGWEDQASARDIAGYATLEMHDEEQVYKQAATRVRSIIERAPGATVAVLVRRRKEITHALEALRLADIDASEEGGNPLTDSPAVAAAVSALICAEHPGDSMAGYHVGVSGLAEPLGITDPLCSDQRSRWTQDVRRALAESGASAVFSSWHERCLPGMGPRDRARFGQLVALVSRIEREGQRLSPVDLAERIRAEKVEAVRPAKVRVMTVHASKGLEFDAVVLPDLGRDFSISRQPILMRRDDPLRPPAVITRYPKEEIQAASPELKAVHESAFAREIYGELCGLYVAMTRAKHALHMIIEQPKKLGVFSANCAGLLRETLSPSAEEAGEMYAHGDPNWAESFVGDADEERPRERRVVPLRLGPEEDARTGALRRASPSSVSARSTSIEASALLRLDRAAADAGTLVHDTFECLAWSDAAPFDAAGARTLLHERHSPGSDRIEEAIGRVERAIADPDVAHALSEVRYAGPGFPPAERIELWRERAFLARVVPEEGGSPALVSGRFDRVVVGYAGEAIQWADVIDYKTEAEPGSEIAAKAEQYRPQLELYRRALCAMTGVHPGAVRTSLIFVDRPAVYELTSEG